MLPKRIGKIIHTKTYRLHDWYLVGTTSIPISLVEPLDRSPRLVYFWRFIYLYKYPYTRWFSVVKYRHTHLRASAFSHLSVDIEDSDRSCNIVDLEDVWFPP